MIFNKKESEGIVKKLNIAMLSAQGPDSPENQVVVTSDTVFEDTDNELDSLAIAMTDLEHIDQVIGEAIDVSQDMMDEEAATRQIQTQQEGVSQASLESLQRNVNRLLKQVGMEQSSNFSVAAYNNKRYNRAALEAALDDIKSAIVRIWKAVMAALSKTMDIVKDMIKKYFNTSIKIKKNCETIKAQAIALKGKVHRTGERVGGYRMARYVRYNNRAIEPGQLVANYDRWTAHNYDFIAAVAGKRALADYRANLEKLADYFTGLGVDSRMNDIKRETDSFGDLMVQRIVSNFDYHRNGVHTTVPFIGDYYYKFDESNLAFTIESIEKLKDLGDEGTHIPLDTSQVVIMCDKLIQHMKYYEQIDLYFNELDSLQKMASKIAENAISNKPDLDFVQRKVISAGSAFTIRIFIDAIRKVGIGARQYDMQVSTAIMQWCAESIRTL